MIHEVNDELDKGKAISFCRFQINNNQNKSKEEKIKIIRSLMLDFESRFVTKTLELMSLNQINYKKVHQAIDISNLI